MNVSTWSAPGGPPIIKTEVHWTGVAADVGLAPCYVQQCSFLAPYLRQRSSILQLLVCAGCVIYLCIYITIQSSVLLILLFYRISNPLNLPWPCSPCAPGLAVLSWAQTPGGTCSSFPTRTAQHRYGTQHSTALHCSMSNATLASTEVQSKHPFSPTLLHAFAMMPLVLPGPR